MLAHSLNNRFNACHATHARGAAPLRGKRLVTVAGLKKETKKLTKTLKSHRKRLESLLSVQQDGVLTQSELHAVLAEVAQLQSTLTAVRQQQRLALHAECDANDSSSDSDSDCEEACNTKEQRRAAARMQLMQQQPQQVQQLSAAEQVQQCINSARQAAPCASTAVGSTTSTTSSSSSVCLQRPPPVDQLQQEQEQSDICQQLPPPQQLAGTGRVLVCQGKACLRKGGLQVLQAASHATSASPGVEVLPCKCLGKCKQGPAMRVRNSSSSDQQPRSAVLTEVSPLEVPEVLQELLG